MPEYRLSLDFTAADDAQAERLAEAWAGTCAAEYGTRMAGLERLHTCWDPKCQEHEGGYVGNPDRPADGEFVQRHDGNSSVHIATAVTTTAFGTRVTTACGNGWPVSVLRHANGDSPRQCHKCWEAM